MSMFFVNPDGSFVKNIFIEEDTMLVSNIDYQNEANFFVNFEDSKNTIFIKHFNIDIQTITEVILLPDDISLKILYFNGQEVTYIIFEPVTLEERDTLLEYLVVEVELTREEELKGDTGGFIRCGAFSFLFCSLCAVTYMKALQFEEIASFKDIVKTTDIFSKVIEFMAKTLGSSVILTFAIFGLLGCGYWAYRLYSKQKTLRISYRNERFEG